MKFLSLTILAALANALAVRSVGTAKGRCQEKLYNVEEKDDLNVPDEDQWTWDQSGGTRAFMQNVPVEDEEDDTRLFMQNIPVEAEGDDTRLFMQDFAVDPNEDYSENMKALNYRAAPGLEKAEEKSSPEDDKQDVEELYDYLDNLRIQIEECVTGDRVEIEKYLPLRKEFNDTMAQVDEFGVEGILSFYMTEFTDFITRVDEIAREMCRNGLGQPENCTQI